MTPPIDMLSIEQVAGRLGLHVRTVRNYVRAGRLKAVRIGKQYRISQTHLDAFTGQTAAPDTDHALARHAEVSSIVQIEAVDADTASRVTNGLMAAAKGRPEGAEALRIDTIYDPERLRLKVILTGDLAATSSLLKFIAAYVQS